MNNKLTEEIKNRIIDLRLKEELPMSKIAKEVNCSITTVRTVLIKANEPPSHELRSAFLLSKWRRVFADPLNKNLHIKELAKTLNTTTGTVRTWFKKINHNQTYKQWKNNIEVKQPQPAGGNVIST